MPTKLDDLYHNFYKSQQFTELKTSIEENHKILIDKLSKEDRKTVLRIIDALEMICNYQTKASFIQGFKLGFELTTELQQYNLQIDEIDSQKAGGSFMPTGGSKDEKENYNQSSSHSRSHYFADGNDLSHRAKSAPQPPHVGGCGGS